MPRVVLSVSGIGVPVISFIFATFLIVFIVLLVRVVMTFGLVIWPCLLIPRTPSFTYASCSVPHACLVFSSFEFPSS